MESAEVLSEALTIPPIESADIRLDDCRRLTGPGLLWDRAGAVADVFFHGVDPAQVAELWRVNARRVLDALGWRDEEVTLRLFAGGANLALSGPEDGLFTAAYAAETAWHFCAAALLGMPPGDFDAMTADLRDLARREADPARIALTAAAMARGLDVLTDDEAVSVGHGAGSACWMLGALPDPGSVDWDGLHDIPLALVTGTNGKTTTTRLIAAMGLKAGWMAGLSSTDAVKVGTEVLAKGDYSGPAGARLLLRDPRVNMAALEVARGGILRRGLPVRHAAVAVVMNAAADHLGHYGVNTVPELAEVKLSVRRGLKAGGVLVLNADDGFVVGAAEGIPEPVWWFSLDPGAPLITRARAAGVPCGWYDGQTLVLSDGQTEAALIAAKDIPLSLNGAARYNLQNALAAALAARALGIGDAAIRATLAGFQSDAVDNPGRCNEFRRNGARVFVDFAHNPHSIAAVTGALAAVPARRRFLLISHAGDRSDEDIRGLALGALALRPDVVVIAENPGYLRGRLPGEVPALIRAALRAAPTPPSAILDAPSPAPGAAMILARLEPDDLALLLVHAERDRIFAMLADPAPAE